MAEICTPTSNATSLDDVMCADALGDEDLPPSPLSLGESPGKHESSISLDQVDNNVCETVEEGDSAWSDPLEYKMLDCITRLPGRMHTKLNSSVRHSKNLLRTLRVQNLRCARQDHPTPCLQRRRSLPNLSPRVVATPREMTVQRSAMLEDEGRLELAVECVTQLHEEVDSLVSAFRKLDKVWALSEARLAVDYRRAQSLKQIQLKRASMDVSLQTLNVEDFLPIHDEAVQLAIEDVEEQVARAPRAGRSIVREECIKNLQQQIEGTRSSLTLLARPGLVCNVSGPHNKPPQYNGLLCKSSSVGSLCKF